MFLVRPASSILSEEQSLKALLDERVQLYNTPAFISSDPVSVPHRFSKPQDIEIAGFFAATLAWGIRTTIINNCTRLMQWMDNAPHDFILHHQPEDLKKMLGFAHRTFNATDLLYFIETLQQHYRRFLSLEDAFVPQDSLKEDHIGPALIHFHNYFFSGEHPERTRKHVSTPARGSACKRLCMYLRWMVRNDTAGVDFGIWKKISPAQLICPLDVHVARVAHRLGLITQNTANWRNALALTDKLRTWRPEDPAAYDYALFGLGIEERF
jgi:uncharacterized protein (TIGR02757 family)